MRQADRKRKNRKKNPTRVTFLFLLNDNVFEIPARSINYCKYERMTDLLKDFLDISFSPPGQMSAGLTCDLLVTFKPKINEDVEGQLFFLSQTGPFDIPVRLVSFLGFFFCIRCIGLP